MSLDSVKPGSLVLHRETGLVFPVVEVRSGPMGYRRAKLAGEERWHFLTDKDWRPTYRKAKKAH